MDEPGAVNALYPPLFSRLSVGAAPIGSGLSWRINTSGGADLAGRFAYSAAAVNLRDNMRLSLGYGLASVAVSRAAGASGGGLAFNMMSFTYYGGPAIVADSVKVLAVPASRRVVLFDVSNNLAVREQWSGGDGVVTFTGLPAGKSWYAVAFDHTGVYPPVSMSYTT